LMMKAE